MSGSTKTVYSDDRNGWTWGFTRQSESWNGRLAMLGFAAILLIEFLSGQGILHFWNFL
ncbi:MAG: chlorophyll a/b-binding protein [Leptolyngbyaceae cyanobacterium bins.349]|nr:chlorophyll a/b-binding protein [Leptolyngbyaceae cyanobacterium bins.349]